jgi:hypothetical protein
LRGLKLLARSSEIKYHRLTTGMLLEAAAGVPFDKAGVLDGCAWAAWGGLLLGASVLTSSGFETAADVPFDCDVGSGPKH